MNEPKALQGEALIRILHPSDFTRASLIAFAHALKIALQANAELEIVHVEPHKIGSRQGCSLERVPRSARDVGALANIVGRCRHR